MGCAWPSTDLVLTTRTGRPIEPWNFVRSFRCICDQNDVRMITVHLVRHTVASLLKDLSVLARDARIILGHSRLAVTLEIYAHAPMNRRSARPSPGSRTSSRAPTTDPLLQMAATDGLWVLPCGSTLT
jgi:integrase